MLLEEAGTTTDVDIDEFRAARPDAISRVEKELIAGQREPLHRLGARVQSWAGRWDSVRLVGLDRFAVRFRVQSRRGCYDVRVPFAVPLAGPADFGPALERLLACGPS